MDIGKKIKDFSIFEQDMDIHANPLSKEDFHYHLYNDLIHKNPENYHLIDVIAAMAYKRPKDSWDMIDKWIKELESNPQIGKPFKGKRDYINENKPQGDGIK